MYIQFVRKLVLEKVYTTLQHAYYTAVYWYIFNILRILIRNML